MPLMQHGAYHGGTAREARISAQLGARGDRSDPIAKDHWDRSDRARGGISLRRGPVDRDGARATLNDGLVRHGAHERNPAGSERPGARRQKMHPAFYWWW